MRPVPIPAEEVWDGARRVVIGPPGNDLDSEVAPVEALVDVSSIGPRMSVRCVLEDDDLETLTSGGTVWVSFYGGQMLPFSVDVVQPVAPAAYARVDVLGVDQFTAAIGGVPDGMSPADFAEGCAQALTRMAHEWRAAEGEARTDLGRC